MKTKINVELPPSTVDIFPEDLSVGVFFLDSFCSLNVIIESFSNNFKYLNLSSNSVSNAGKETAIQNLDRKLWKILTDFAIKDIQFLE